MILVNALKVHYSLQMKFKFLCCSFLFFVQAHFAMAKEIILEEGRSVQQESQLVFSRIMVGDFKNSATQQIISPDLCSYIVDEINLKSYWDSKCIAVTRVGDKGAINGSDAVLTGEWKDDQLNLLLRSKNLKYTLGSWRIPIPLPDGVLLKPAAEQLVAFLIAQIPMIAHVMKTGGNSKVMINLGSRKAVRIGQTFKVFDFTSVDHPLNGKQKDIAKIEILTIQSPETSIASVSYNSPDDQSISTGAKIKIDDSALVKSNLTQREGEKSWIALGSQLMNIRVSTDPFSTVQKRNYNFNYTPFVDFAFGTKKMYAHAMYGQAAGPSADISYLEIEAGTDIYKNNFREGFLLLGAGLNVSQFTAFNHVTPSLYEDSQRISPFMDARLQYEPRPRFVFFLGGKLLYPVFSGSQIGGAQIFSYAAEPYVGAKIQMSSKFAAEVMARSRYYSINYSGNSGIRETETAYLLRGIYLIN